MTLPAGARLRLSIQGEVGVALGYWAATYFELRPATGAPPLTNDPAEVLARTMAIVPLHDLKLHELLWRNMRDAAAVAEFAPVVDWLEIDDATRAKMAATGLAIFAATQHFAALHIVTGLHWLRIVEPHADRATFFALLRHFWRGVAGLVGELEFPALPDAATLARWRALPTYDWATLQAAAATGWLAGALHPALPARYLAGDAQIAGRAAASCAGDGGRGDGGIRARQSGRARAGARRVGLSKRFPIRAR